MELRNLAVETRDMLLNEHVELSDVDIPRQPINKTIGFKTNRSTSRKKNKKVKTIPKGIFIPQSNVEPGKNQLVDKLFLTCSERIKSYSPHVWKNMTEEQLNMFSRKLYQDNIIEAMTLG